GGVRVRSPAVGERPTGPGRSGRATSPGTCGVDQAGDEGAELALVGAREVGAPAIAAQVDLDEVGVRPLEPGQIVLTHPGSQVEGIGRHGHRTRLYAGVHDRLQLLR